MPNYRWLFHRRVQHNRNHVFNLSPLHYAVIEQLQYQARVKLTGSFRLSAGNRHLHRYCIFTELLPETVPQSLRHSCTSELTRQGISLFYSSRRTLSSSFDFAQGLTAPIVLGRMCGVGLSLTTSDSMYISIQEVAFSRRMIRMFT